jgi:hypothetical protein
MSKILENPVNIDFIKSFIEVADPGCSTTDVISITPELADHLDGHCFLDLDMPERLEGFQFHKANNGITLEYCGTDGYGVAYIDPVDGVDKFGKHVLDNTYCGGIIYEVVFNKKENLEIPVEAYEHIKHFVQQQMAIKKANSEYINTVRDIIIKNAIKND